VLVVGCIAVLVAVGAVTFAGPAAAATPVGWPDTESVSTLRALLLFGGIPVALIVLIALLVLIPTILRGPQQGSGAQRWSQPQWFGGPAVLDAGPSQGGTGDRTALESGATTSPGPHAGTTPTGSTVLAAPDTRPAAPPADKGGGAGARW
jgi:hypothetical protein